MESQILLGLSRAVMDVVEEAQYAAPSDSKVLITGESGAGKEVLAHLIHQRSHRSRRPMITINCAGVPESLAATVEASEAMRSACGPERGFVRNPGGPNPVQRAQRGEAQGGPEEDSLLPDAVSKRLRRLTGFLVDPTADRTQ